MFSVVYCERTGRMKLFEGDAAEIRKEADDWARSVPGCRVVVLEQTYISVAPIPRLIGNETLSDNRAPSVA